jgi:Pyridine nucleotide-disulphide oxidoreductase.
MRGYDWATKIKAALTDDSIKNVAVVGSGYIGIEAAEVFAKKVNTSLYLILSIVPSAIISTMK